MKYLVRFFVIILITFYSITNANTEELSIVYMNMKKVMNETIAGKSLSQQLEIIHKSNITYFKKSSREIRTNASKANGLYFSSISEYLISSTSVFSNLFISS